MDLFVLGLDPCQLVHDLIAPLVHALVANVHLRVEDPQEAEAFFGEHFDWNVHNFRVGHRIVVEVELVVREHKARVVPLCSLDPPWRVNVHHLEVAKLIYEVLQVKEPEVAVNECVRSHFEIFKGHLVSWTSAYLALS